VRVPIVAAQLAVAAAVPDDRITAALDGYRREGTTLSPKKT